MKKNIDIETFLQRVRKRETKAQLTVEDSVRLWLMRSGVELKDAGVIPYAYAPAIKPRRFTFNQKEGKA